MSTTLDHRLRVSVLGSVRAWLGEHELPLGPARQRALFAVLAAAAGRPVGRDELIEGIWGTSPPATAAGSVYTYVSGLRRSLATPGLPRSSHHLLTSGPSGYALRLSPEDLDSERFLAFCHQAQELREADPQAAATRWDEALALWHGEAYAGVSGPRIETERTRLAERRLTATEQRARLGLHLGDDDLLATLSGLVHENPLHEPLYELLMLALHRIGRRTAAIEVFRAARHTLLAELGVGPGPALTELHRRLLAEPAAPAIPATRPTPPILPSEISSAACDGQARVLAGRDDELTMLRVLVRAVVAGHGTALWIEGEPGIGKTELLTAAIADANGLGCQIAWGAADELDQDAPLQVIWRALGVRATSEWHRPPNPADAAERLLAHVRASCETGPLVLVVDNFQWVDEVSCLLWDRLIAATRRMPLLLVAATRLGPYGHALAQLRRSVQAREGHALRLRTLPPAAIEQLVAQLVGAPVGPYLAAVVPRLGGNPLGAREVITALVRRGAVRISDGCADIDTSVPVEAPRSLLVAIRAIVDLLSPATQEVLRTAALLGPEFSGDDIVAVTGRSPVDLVANLEEALAAHIVVEAGSVLAFRHPLVRRMLYEGIPAPARAALHRHTAEVLHRGGGSATRVAEQLAAGEPPVDEWMVSWLVERHAEVTKRAPQVAGHLLRRVLDTDVPSTTQRAVLLIALVRLDFRHQRWSMAEAREAAGLARDPADRAEMRHLLATMAFRRGDAVAATSLLEASLRDPEAPELWRTSHHVLLATFRRGSLDDLDSADRTAGCTHSEAVAAGQPYEAAFALQTVWLTNSIRRDHERALEYVDRALDTVRGRRACVGMYLDLLDNRTFTLQNLDRLDEAERTLREAALVALRHRLPHGLPVATAVQHYWLGRWDDALTTLSAVRAVADDNPGITFLGNREPGAVTMLLHGVAALIAAHHDDAGLVAEHLAAVHALPATDAERASSDFLLVARSLVAEQQGRADEALDVLAPLLAPSYAPMMLRHQWLPGVVRLALDQRRTDVVEWAVEICAGEANKEVRPARADAAAQRCRALITGDPEPALAAAARYRRVGRAPELAAALEDAAVLLAADRRPHEAIRVCGEAVSLYSALGARWDLRRIRRRLAEFGVDRSREAVSVDRRSVAVLSAG
ncbi:BTAD domain-containing putative transcriptional regulator [Salinispora arenicola]|uniref:BTAD domain-containing putative transcriptional regulator n=1 Tax=Salinispora arenicola TaxID=168697 RepID=UPI000373BD53|nr:BTAD domain-containing putative transcriptional regulator [Salinispora arenicola]